MDRPRVIWWRLYSLSRDGVEEKDVVWPAEIRYLEDVEQTLDVAPVWDEDLRTELTTTCKAERYSWKKRETWTVYQSKPKGEHTEPVPMQFRFEPSSEFDWSAYEAHFTIRIGCSDVCYQQKYADD